MNKTMTKTFFAVLAAVTVGMFARAGELLTGDVAVAKFPASLQQMGLTDAKWMQLTNGVEYYYGYFTNLLGTLEGYTKSKNAVHLLRIDYAKAPVMMKFVDHTQESPTKWTTSKTAARDNALFAINLMMEYKDSSVHPHGYAKANGVVIPNGMTLSDTNVKGGYAFNDDKTYAFSKDWTATNPATGRIYADDWANVFTKEATTMSNGKVTWGSGASYFGRANYPFFGTTADGVIWAGTVDGRNSTSDGLGYHEVAALQKELGCIDGVCCDGGGSTTMAIRKDLMTVSDICPTQKLSSDADNKYYTMNFLFDGSLDGILSNGSERKVINQLLFVEAPAAPEDDRPGVTISEVMAKNEKTLTTASGVKGIDWVEIHNSGSEDVDLSGWYLGNDPTKKTSKWPLIEGSCVVPANGYKIVWCDGDGVCTSWADGEAHVACNVSTEAGKHTVFLASAADKEAIVCQVPMREGLEDISYGYAAATDDFRYFPTPTPGAANAANGRTGFTPKVVFSEPHGYKSASFQLSLSCPGHDDAQIYYTTNGVKPTVGGAGSTKYTGPITISKTTVVRAAVPDADSLRQNDTSATYLFISDILTQSASNRPEGFPAGNYNNQVIKYGMRSADSLGDVDAATATARLYDGFTNGIRTVSFVLDPDDYFSSSRGIYVNAHKEGDEWERQTLVEQIYPVDTNDEFSVTCGVRIRGAYSRGKTYPKHAFRLFFRSEYGMNSLNHPLFGKEGPQSFGKIDLRCEQNSAWANNQADNTMVHEVFSRDSQRDMGQPYDRSNYYHLFLNGCYWGIYQTEERVDQKYCADNVGGSEENYDIARTTNVNNGSASTYTTGIVEGDTAAWTNLWYISMKEGYGAGKEANYYRVRGLNPDGSRNPDYPIYLNVTNLICFMLTSQYGADADSPANINNMPNNIVAYRNRVDGDGDIDGFLWNRHDSEQSLGHGEFHSSVNAGVNFLVLGTRKNGKTALADFNPQMLHYELCANAEYKRTFADLVQKHILTPGGAMSPEACKERYRARMAEIDDAVMAELARWGGSWNRSTWTGNCNKDLGFFDQRTYYLINNYRDSSLKWFPSVDAAKVVDATARQLADGEKLSVGDRVFLTGGSSGTVYYTTDGSDPWLSDGSVSDRALVYDGGEPGVVYKKVINQGDVWKYSDAGEKPAADWYADDYVDSSWKSGASKLGFGGDGTYGQTINRYLGGASSGTQVTTYYFRRTFTLPDGADKLTSLRANLDCDDGYIVYINGVEVKKDQVASSEYSAFSTATNLGQKEIDWTFAAGLLRAGENTIAVEVHQCSETSSDAWWNLELSYPDAGSVTGGIEVPQNGMKVMARVKTASEWSALSEITIGVNEPVIPPAPVFYTGVYDEKVEIGTPGEYVFSNAVFNAGVELGNGTYILTNSKGTTNTASCVTAAGTVVFKQAGTFVLEGSGTNALMTVDDLFVSNGTFKVVYTSEEAKSAAVDVLGSFVVESEGTVDVTIAGTQGYGIYLENKNKTCRIGDGGAFKATVDGAKCAALYGNKGSVDAEVEAGSKVMATLSGTEARLFNFAGKIKLKGGKITVTGAEEATDAKVFKSDKSISVKNDVEIDIQVPAPGSEAFSCADTFEMTGGKVEVVSGDDCVGAETNVVVSGGKFYGCSVGNDVFDTNEGDITIEGGLVLAYTTAQESVDDPGQTVGSFGFDVNTHTVNLNGGTIVAIGGDNLTGDHFPTISGEQAVFVDAEVPAADYSGKFISCVADGTNTTVGIPAIDSTKCTVLFSVHGMTEPPKVRVSETAPATGSIDFHEVYLAAIVPFELAEPAPRPSTDYNGNVVTVAFTGDIPEGAELTAELELADAEYRCVGTVDAESGLVTFEVDDAVVTAGNVYAGSVTVCVDGVAYLKDVTLEQGTIRVDTNTGWICESAAQFETTGEWSGEKAEVATDAIAVSDAVFTAATAAPEAAVVTITSEFAFNGEMADAFDPALRAAVKVAKVANRFRYVFLTADGAVTNTEVEAKAYGVTSVTVKLDNVANTVLYTVGGVEFGPFAAKPGAVGVSKVRYYGETEVSSLLGAYETEVLDANLAKSGDAEYATVAEALAAADQGAVELLWDASWNPSAAGDYNIATNGHVLVIGGEMAYSVKDNGDGTVTVTVTGGETPDAPEAASIVLAGQTVKVGVRDLSANCWYALAKTTDLKQSFTVDPTTWTSGADLIAGTKELSITLADGETQAFYRVVVSATEPAK